MPRFGCALELWHKGDLHLEKEEIISAWSDEERDLAKSDCMTSGDLLLSADVEESIFVKLIEKFRLEIGDGTYSNWQNRLTLAVQREIDNKKKKAEPPQTANKLDDIITSNWFKLREIWNQEPGMVETHLQNRAKKLIKEWGGDNLRNSEVWKYAILAGQEKELSKC